MKITNLKTQLKDPDRVSVFIDDKFWCGLTVAQIVELGVKKGMDLDQPQANSLKKQSEMGKMLARAIDWLMRRPRSRRELADYLRKKQYEEEESGYITSRLEKYLDDESFARFWVDGRRSSKLKSSKEISFELARKGVDRDMVAAALQNNELDDKVVIRKLIEKRRLKSKYPDRNKLVAYLARKGFSYSLIDEALAE